MHYYCPNIIKSLGVFVFFFFLVFWGFFCFVFFRGGGIIHCYVPIYFNIYKQIQKYYVPKECDRYPQKSSLIQGGGTTDTYNHHADILSLLTTSLRSTKNKRHRIINHKL